MDVTGGVVVILERWAETREKHLGIPNQFMNGVIWSSSSKPIGTWK